MLNRSGTVFATLALVVAAGACSSQSSNTDGGGRRIRLVHAVAGGPAVDFCYRTALDGAFRGPALGANLPGGLRFGQTSAYAQIDGTPNAVRLIPAGAASCDQDLAGTSSTDILSAGSNGDALTIVVRGLATGTGDQAIHLSVEADTTTAPATGSLLRFWHAAAGTPALDFGTLANGTFAPLFTNVGFGSRSSGGTTDSRGYATLQSAPLTTSLVLRQTGNTADLLTVANAAIPGAAVLSVFAIGTAGGTGDATLALLICNDSAPAAAGLASCTRVSM